MHSHFTPTAASYLPTALVNPNPMAPADDGGKTTVRIVPASQEELLEMIEADPACGVLGQTEGRMAVMVAAPVDEPETALLTSTPAWPFLLPMGDMSSPMEPH